ncbi:MAG: Spy/CpxP family protein refolding chaperone [Pseudomonadales bacterium]
MKKTTFVMGLAALLAMATTAAIADNHGAGHIRGEHMERMVEDLELTPAQQNQLMELHQARQREMQARRQEMQARREAGEEMDPEAMRAEMQAKRAQMDEDLKGILTDEQWAKFEERRAVRMKERGHRGKGHEGKQGENNRS